MHFFIMNVSLICSASWNYIWKWNCIYLRCTTWYFGTNWEIFTMTKELECLLPHSYHFSSFNLLCVFPMRTSEICPFTRDQVCNTVLIALVPSLYIRTPEPIQPAQLKIYALDKHHSTSPPPSPGNHFSTLCF